MVQSLRNIPKSKTSNRVQRKGSKRRAKPSKVQKVCDWCGSPYRGVAQSSYCCPGHMEAASRARKEALIEPLAQFLHHYSERLTADLWGRAVQISYGQAARKAAECIEVNYVGFKYRMMALGYVYDERLRQWRCPALLVQSTIA